MSLVTTGQERRQPSASREATPQSRLAAELLEATSALERTIDALVRPMEPHDRRTRTLEGGWSVDEILEHLCLANRDYLSAMEHALATARPLEDGGWRATLGGRLLVWAMESPRRAKAPSAIVPAITPRPDVLDAMLESLHRLQALLQGAAAHEWRRLRLSSPYARWLRLNFGDAALVVVRHAERHARQMARTAQHVVERGSVAPSATTG